jgi:hypothetical protein
VTIVALVSPSLAWETPAASPAHSSMYGVPPPSSADQYCERRYRIIGRLRLVLFWVGFDDVGGARMTRRSHDNATTVALLAGSDPQRTPRKVNQWVYLREETRVDRAEAFALRTLEKEAPTQVEGATDDGSRISASCTSINHDRMDSTVRTVSTETLTYRMFGHALDQVAASTRWQAQRVVCPVGAAPGFLSALERVIRGAVAAPFAYNGALYELQARRRESLGRKRVGARTYESLMRAELAVIRRENGETTTFSMTYASDSTGIPLPVQVFYQPSFWISIELRQDDAADVPPDPAESRSTLTRIQAICNVETE